MGSRANPVSGGYNLKSDRVGVATLNVDRSRAPVVNDGRWGTNLFVTAGAGCDGPCQARVSSGDLQDFSFDPGAQHGALADFGAGEMWEGRGRGEVDAGVWGAGPTRKDARSA